MHESYRNPGQASASDLPLSGPALLDLTVPSLAVPNPCSHSTVEIVAASLLPSWLLAALCMVDTMVVGFVETAIAAVCYPSSYKGTAVVEFLAVI